LCPFTNLGEHRWDKLQEAGIANNYSAKPSGGTLSTVLGILDVYSVKELAAAHSPYGICPIPGPKVAESKSLITKIFGIRTVPDLGILTTSFGGVADRPIVHRSWGLLGGDKFYGPNFRFSEFMKARNYLGAVFIHFAITMGALLLAFPFFRSLARKYVYQPGDGPTKEQSKNDRVEYRGIGIPDVQTPNPPRAFCKASFQGSLYQCKYTSLYLQLQESLTCSSHRHISS
jgi:hypothetical protein